MAIGRFNLIPRTGFEPTVRTDICESAEFHKDPVVVPRSVNCLYSTIGETLRSHNTRCHSLDIRQGV